LLFQKKDGFGTEDILFLFWALTAQKKLDTIFAPMYKLIRFFLFLVDPEKIHYFTFECIRLAHKIPGMRKLLSSIYRVEDPRLKRTLFGIEFQNPIGLAAGFDKNAVLFDEFYSFGFGAVEIGTVTPMPQPGNDKLRLFRLPKDQALINRMGFNNFGSDSAAARLRFRKPGQPIIGGNIGKNKMTPNEDAGSDYLKCLRSLHDSVDYFTVNVSSPNTPGLRALQDKEPLMKILADLKEENSKYSNPKPILLKIAPDLTNEQLDDIIEIVRVTKIEGVIASNTTISREGLVDENKSEMGGLSGAPVTKRSTEVIKYLKTKSGNAFPVIGVGGIMTVQDALDKLDAGADLIQLYTGFIYSGPALVKKINKAILNRQKI
jgi:dihydroorotate dehydrogenase